jgi:release factor glutamine methyltransferase
VARYEPRLALDGGVDGLDLIRKFMPGAATFIRPGGMLLMEIEADQSEVVMELALNAFPESSLRMVRDFAGLPRLIVIQAG